LRYQIDDMNLKSLLVFSLALFSLSVSAQNKTFAFSEIQSRNNLQQWGNSQNVGQRVARFTPTEINLNVDTNYHLNIISKTDLPDNGVIYLCKDEKANAVTVMLIDNIKMYLYSKTKRFLINFDTFNIQGYMADTD